MKILTRLPALATVAVTGLCLAATGTAAATAASPTVAYDAATGAVAWVARYGHPAQNSAAHGVAVSPDSSKVYVTGDTATYGTTIGYNS